MGIRVDKYSSVLLCSDIPNHPFTIRSRLLSPRGKSLVGKEENAGRQNFLKMFSYP